MKSRQLLVALILLIAVLAIWEWKKSPSTPQAPPVIPAAPPAAAPAPPPIVAPPPAPRPLPPPKRKPTAIPKQPAPKKNVARPAPTVPIVPRRPVAPPPPAPVIPLPPEAPPPMEWQGNSDTSVKHEGQIVVKTDAQWVHFWSEHHPHEAAPEVDFSKNMVVGVFLGRRPSDGFVATITSVRPGPDGVEVDYIERPPPPGTFQIGVEAYPYHIKVIPRSNPRVKFVKQTAQYQKETLPAKAK